MSSELRFPKNFYFGAATSAHQVEGGNHNDWTEWEHANSARLAAEAARRHANGKTRGAFFRKKIAPSPPTRIPDYILKNYPHPLQEENYILGKACDHYNRFQEDFDLAKEIGLNAYRFSVEWSRIEPEEGKFNQKEVEHYRKVIRACRERGIEPFVTLWHWTLPAWVAKQGGWESKKTIFYFSRFGEKIATEFRKDVKFWIILNEPGLWAADAYLFGFKPPARKNFWKLIRVYFNLTRAQKKTYRRLKNLNSSFEVGISEGMEYTDIPVFSHLRNYFFISRIKNSFDFLGINYYRRRRFFGSSENISDMGWEIYPRGLHYFLKKSWRLFKKPIFITENGLADARDLKRADFIQSHLHNIKQAIQEGVDVRGYFHWSLLDNFEWEKGFWPRFGLVEVDYKTQERKIRKSAKIYTSIIQNAKL